MMEKEGTGREGTNFFEDNIDSDYNKEGGGGGGGNFLDHSIDNDHDDNATFR